MRLELDKLRESFPFLSKMIVNTKISYYGIVLNCDKNAVTFINLEKIQTKEELVKLMNLSQNWWWYSNRSIPLNLFYQKETEEYMPYVTSLPFKTTTIEGHVSSLEDILNNAKTSRKNRSFVINNKV